MTSIKQSLEEDLAGQMLLMRPGPESRHACIEKYIFNRQESRHYYTQKTIHVNRKGSFKPGRRDNGYLHAHLYQLLLLELVLRSKLGLSLLANRNTSS